MNNEIMQLCRLCLVKDRASVPIFAEQSDRQIFVKITACLPIRVSREDSLPKKICDSCLDKLDSLYQFRNTTVNAEKQLLTWLGPAIVETEFNMIQGAPLMQTEIHSIKQEELDPLGNIPENMHENFVSLADPHFPKLIPFSGSQAEFYRIEDERFQSNNLQKITRDDSGSAPAKRTKQQVAPKLVNNDDAENKEEVYRTATATVIVKDNECIDAEDMGKNPQINFTSSEIDGKDQAEIDGKEQAEIDGKEQAEIDGKEQAEIDGKEQAELFGMHQKDEREDILKKASKSFQVPSAGQCPICAKMCRSHLKRHMLAHTDERPVACDVCFVRFKDKFAMLAHKKCHSDAKPFKCTTCDKTFKRKVALETHQRRHVKDYKIVCEICNKGFYMDVDYKLHWGSKHGQSSYICPICNKAFYNKDSLNKHKLQHAEDYKDAKYKCDLCGKSFLRKTYLKNHINKQHTDGLRREYVCDLCGKKLYSGSSLRAHQRMHEGIKPNKCDTCGKCFNIRSSLIDHLRIHTGEKPHKCEHCHKAFTQRNTYVIHMRSHTGERPYVCQLCDTGFVSRTALNLHQKSKHNLLKT